MYLVYTLLPYIKTIAKLELNGMVIIANKSNLNAFKNSYLFTTPFAYK